MRMYFLPSTFCWNLMRKNKSSSNPRSYRIFHDDLPAGHYPAGYELQSRRHQWAGRLWESGTNLAYWSSGGCYFMTAYADTDKAVRAIKAGATDFIPKPWEKEKLLATLSSGIKLRRSRCEVNLLKNKWRYLAVREVVWKNLLLVNLPRCRKCLPR